MKNKSFPKTTIKDLPKQPIKERAEREKLYDQIEQVIFDIIRIEQRLKSLSKLL